MRGVGRLPGHDHCASAPVGRDQCRAREQAVGDHGVRALFHRFALGRFGAWVSGPKDLQTDATEVRVLLGLRQHDHRPGLFAAGDASGASSHKFSSGSFTEGRIAGKGAICLHRRPQHGADSRPEHRSKRCRPRF